MDKERREEIRGKRYASRKREAETGGGKREERRDTRAGSDTRVGRKCSSEKRMNENRTEVLCRQEGNDNMLTGNTYYRTDRDRIAMLNFINQKDKLIIFMCCLVIYICQDDLSVSVTTILISIIFSGFLSFFDNEKLKTVLTAGYSVLSCFVPAIIIFLPLIIYDMLFYKYQYINLIGIIPFIYFLNSASVQTISMVTVMLFLSVFVKYRTEAQIKLHARYNDLSDKTREMSIQLTKQNNDLIKNQDNEMYTATLNERNRIAREIHDNVGHLLSSAILQSGAILTVSRDDKIREHIKNLNDTLSQAMNNIRNSVHELYDESIDLNAQIKNIIKQFTYCEISYDCDISSNPGKKLKYAFISIVKEALSNIVKHSDATHVDITFREHPALYQLIIRDNGTVKNFSADNGLGLKNMSDRIHSFNGYFNILTEKGFEIFISVPKEGLQT